MAGRGPAPKDPNRRARGKRGEQQTILKFEPMPQPDLPAGYHWPERTREWWAAWGRAPQAELFSETDWQFLIDTALLHAQAWNPDGIDPKHLSELRLRVAKFGATIEDRARLRITFADADERDNRRAEPAPAERWGDLRALPVASSD
jgi:hypothetical protein